MKSTTRPSARAAPYSAENRPITESVWSSPHVEPSRPGSDAMGCLDPIDLRLIDTFPASDAVARY